MIQIKNKIIPFKGFKAITIWPFMFYKEQMSVTDLNHEAIHASQQKEMFLFAFYAKYLTYKYENNPFEREAYANESNLNYLKTRKRNAWKNYIS
jgi:hypothetical protein